MLHCIRILTQSPQVDQHVDHKQSIVWFILGSWIQPQV